MKRSRLFYILLLIIVCSAGLAGVAIKQLSKPLNITKQPDIASEPTASPLAASTVETLWLPFTEQQNRAVLVYLPKGYDATRKPNNTYPTIFLLHGSPGQPSDWSVKGKAIQTFDRLIDSGTLPPTIVVFPDGNGGLFSDTQYINSTDGKQPNETFITKTVLEFIDNRYRTSQDSHLRAIGGLSSGGFGAINLGLKHQDLYGYILSFSGYGKIERNILSNQMIQGSEKTITDNSPLLYIPSLTDKTATLWLTAGAQDAFFAENQKLTALLKKNDFNVTFTSTSGTHEWEFWTPRLEDSLRWLADQWKMR